jgi:hypothetical protein
MSAHVVVMTKKKKRFGSLSSKQEGHFIVLSAAPQQKFLALKLL